MQYVKIISIIIAISYIVFTICRNIVNLRDINSTFTCKYCNTLNRELSNEHSCTNCGRVFRNITKSWTYFVMFKVSKIDTKIKKKVYHYKDFITLPKIELTLSIILLIIMLIALTLILIY